MSAGERVTDLVAEPIAGTGKGIWEGVKAGAKVLGVLGAVAGAALAMWLVGPASIVAGIFTLAAGAAIGGAGGLMGGAVWGGQIGGVIGMFGGLGKGIYRFFGGRDGEVPARDKELDMMREAVGREAQVNEAMRRRLERQESIGSIGGTPEARNDNAARFAAPTAQGLTPPPLPGK